MRVQSMKINLAIIGVALLIGCGSASTESSSERSGSSVRNESKINTDLLSPAGELFPLSTYFGVCMKDVDALRSKFDNGMLSPHYPTYAEITGSGGVMKISVGKFGVLPGTRLKEIPASVQPRRIQLGQDRAHNFVLASEFGAGSNLVSIVYDGESDVAKAEAIRIANNVVPCHLSVGQSIVNGL